jgi:hypothetical protein
VAGFTFADCQGGLVDVARFPDTMPPLVVTAPSTPNNLALDGDTLYVTYSSAASGRAPDVGRHRRRSGERRRSSRRRGRRYREDGVVGRRRLPGQRRPDLSPVRQRDHVGARRRGVTEHAGISRTPGYPAGIAANDSTIFVAYWTGQDTVIARVTP